MRDGFYKRGEYWWTRLGGKRVTTGCKDRQAAELWRRDQERRNADPAYSASKDTTLRKAINVFIASRVEKKNSPATVSFYEQKLASVADVLGELLTLDQITAALVDDLVSQRRGHGASEHTISKELGALRGVLRLAKRKRWISTDYRDLLPIGHSPDYQPRKTKLTPAQAKLLLEQLSPERAAHVAFVIATGARRGEAARARREDRGVGSVHLRGTKTAKSDRIVPVLSLFAELLERAYRDGPGPVGKPLFDFWQNARRDIIAACERAAKVEGNESMPSVTWNDLRRTHAGWLRDRGVEPQLLAELLGHTTTQMAERVYGRIEGAALGTLAEQRLAASAPAPKRKAKPRKKPAAKRTRAA